MKRITLATSIALSMSLLSGCAAIGKASDSLSYKTGTFVSDEQLSQIKPGTKQDQVVAIMGYPTDKLNVSGKEVWRYPYSKVNAIPLAGKNESFTTVVEFNAKGVVIGAYKANGYRGKTGNALLDAAHGQ